jgi:single-strand DNA-binding protein
MGVLSSSSNWRKNMSVNKVILVGRLGRDPETRYTGSGQAVCNFSLATDESFKSKSGERQKRTEWHKIVVWGKQAEIAQQYLKKGAQIYLEGRIQSREWMDKENQKRTSFEIVATNFRMLGSRSDSMGGGAARGAAAGAADFEADGPAPMEHEPSGSEVSDEDIPF